MAKWCIDLAFDICELAALAVFVAMIGLAARAAVG